MNEITKATSVERIRGLAVHSTEDRAAIEDEDRAAIEDIDRLMASLGLEGATYNHPPALASALKILAGHMNINQTEKDK